jgi:hypothetical protein
VAAVLVFPDRLWAVFTGRRLAIAVLGFTLGVFPLLVYNLENGWATFRGNVKRDTSDLPGKARMLMETAKGDGLFGWMFNEKEQTPQAHAPSGIIQATSARISSLARHPRQHLLFDAFLLALLLAPLARGNDLRAILFGTIAMTVAWVQMATNAGTGGSVHHTILLWPFPQFVVAVSFAAASKRLGRAGVPVLAVAAIVMTASAVLVGNEYFYVCYTLGGTPAWSDSMVPLADSLKGVRGTVYCVDWGMLDPLRYLSHGKLMVAVGDDPIGKPQLTAEDREAVLRMLDDPGALFVTHTKDFENFPGRRDKLVNFAADAGYQRETVTAISDSFGHPAYEVYRFSK